MDQAESVCYVWSEYALKVRPSELATLLDNPRVRTATSKTRCSVLFTRRVLNRRQQTSEWARYSIVRITGPDDQSISQCNRLLEQAIPGYQYRKEYPRRAPVTLYSKNVEAEGDLRSRFGDAVLKKKKTRGLSESDSCRIPGNDWQGSKQDESRAISAKSQRNIDSPIAGPNSFVIDSSPRIQDGRAPTASSQIKLETHISSRSSNSEGHITVTSQTITSTTVSKGTTSIRKVTSKVAVETIHSTVHSSDADESVRNSKGFADHVNVVELNDSVFADEAQGHTQSEVNLIQKFGSVTSSVDEPIENKQSIKSQDLTESNFSTSTDPTSIVPSIGKLPEKTLSDSHISLNIEITQNPPDQRDAKDDLAVRAVLAKHISFDSTASLNRSDRAPIETQVMSNENDVREHGVCHPDLGSSYAVSSLGVPVLSADPNSSVPSTAKPPESTLSESHIPLDIGITRNPPDQRDANDDSAVRAVLAKHVSFDSTTSLNRIDRAPTGNQVISNENDVREYGVCHPDLGSSYAVSSLGVPVQSADPNSSVLSIGKPPEDTLSDSHIPLDIGINQSPPDQRDANDDSAVRAVLAKHVSFDSTASLNRSDRAPTGNQVVSNENDVREHSICHPDLGSSYAVSSLGVPVQSADPNSSVLSIGKPLEKPLSDSHISLNIEITLNPLDHHDVNDGSAVRAVLAKQVSLDSTASSNRSDRAPTGNQVVSDDNALREHSICHPDLGSSYAVSSLGAPIQSAPKVCDCSASMVGEPWGKTSGFSLVDESESFRVVIKEESDVDRILKANETSKSTMQASVESKEVIEECVTETSMSTHKQSNRATFTIELPIGTNNNPVTTAVTDILIAVNYKDDRSDPENGAYKMDNVMEVPLAHSGMDETTTSFIGSKGNISVSGSSLTPFDSKGRNELDQNKAPSLNVSIPVNKPHCCDIDTAAINEHPVCTCVPPSPPPDNRQSDADNQKPTVDETSSARLVLMESGPLTQEGKSKSFETHIALQFSLCRQSSEELLNMGEPNIRQVQDTTRQPSTTRPLLSPISPSAGFDHRDTSMNRLATSPALQPTSPVSVATSISTNLEVHVNRETGHIDVSFEVNGAPIPGIYPDNTAPNAGPSFSAEWSVKLERNTAFGPIGFITSTTQSPVSPAEENAT